MEEKRQGRQGLFLLAVWAVTALFCLWLLTAEGGAPAREIRGAGEALETMALALEAGISPELAVESFCRQLELLDEGT